MAILRRITIAVLTVAMLATGVARAASTTNYSDQWWVASESGWGASVLQQADTLFIDLFVYGTDGKPTWFTAAAYLQGNAPANHALFTGDLYSTSGALLRRGVQPGRGRHVKVGTLTFDADSVNTRDPHLQRQRRAGGEERHAADLAQRKSEWQLLRWRRRRADLVRRGQRPLGGGGFHPDQPCCGQLDHDDLEELCRARSFTSTGTYSQSGHMGQIIGTGSDAAAGITATFNFFEIERTIAGITGRGHIVIQSKEGSCVWDGRWGGVRR